MKRINDKSDQIKLDSDRRGFIKLSAVAGAGVAASVMLPGVALATPEESKTEASTQKGYQLTPHVLQYYKSAAS